MRNKHALFSILILPVLFASISGCNPTKRLLSKTHRQYEKRNTEFRTVENDSSTVYWRKVGTGEQKLILIHGFGAATELQWEKVVKLLSRDFTMYIPDLIYFGNSSSKYDLYDPRFITRQLYRTLPKEAGDRFFVAGISFGGLIGSIFAHEYDRETKGLILIDALSIFADRSRTDDLARSKGYDTIDEILIPDNGKALKAMFEISFYKPKRYPAFLLNQPAKTLYADQRTEKGALLEYMRNNAADIQKLDLSYPGPVRIIWGEEDRLISPDNARQLHAYYPDSELYMLPKVGHVANMEDPEKTAEIIRSLKSYK